MANESSPQVKYELLAESCSQAGQESFVLNVLRWKRFGYYVEIGAFDHTELSNTKALEEMFGWRGISLEIDPERTATFNKFRNNPAVCLDATKCDYASLLESHGAPLAIDYLQVDIEPARQTFRALTQILRSGFRFGVITFEHDVYISKRNMVYKVLAFCILTSYGYRRVASNISNNGSPFEDWYVNRDLDVALHCPPNSEWTSLFKNC